MTTDFSSLPVVDVAAVPLHSDGTMSWEEVTRLSEELHKVFSTTGFAYLVNPPLSLSHDEVFGLAREFFSLSDEEKMKLAKKTFRQTNSNTYRGYFPPQPGHQDNLKEGFEIGPKWDQLDSTIPEPPEDSKFNLNETNLWPPAAVFPETSRAKMEILHDELQSLSIRLLALLAHALGSEGFFSGLSHNSISTLRLLHYPPQSKTPSTPPAEETPGDDDVRLCCTPHTDSGILTLLHQDATGGLEVRNASGDWVSAPYIPGSIVVNIGDLMARASGGKYVATFHRVRANISQSQDAGSGGDGMGRFSVPFFFEPGEDCVVESIKGDEGVVYGEHVRAKMSTWVEFQDAKA